MAGCSKKGGKPCYQCGKPRYMARYQGTFDRSMSVLEGKFLGTSGSEQKIPNESGRLNY